MAQLKAEYYRVSGQRSDQNFDKIISTKIRK